MRFECILCVGVCLCDIIYVLPSRKGGVCLFSRYGGGGVVFDVNLDSTMMVLIIYKVKCLYKGICLYINYVG